MEFYLGVPHPAWLERTAVPLMVSHRWLRSRRRLPRARGPWVLDSGAFSELRINGGWRETPARAYAAAVRRYVEEIGGLAWAAPQDWMCEPSMLERTGFLVLDHQRLTVDNFIELRSLAPDLPIIPVLQGWTLADYHACLERYARAGVDLLSEPIVGLGSVCRRQATSEILDVVASLRGLGLRLHGFGVKKAGLLAFHNLLDSADSMAWSLDARRNYPPMPGHRHLHCSNCLEFALAWRARLLARPAQLRWAM